MSKKPEINNITEPVYKVLHKEIEDAKGEIPTEQEITALANAAIVADKDILSRIVYDEESHTITFPQYVLPLTVLTDDFTYYFNYESGDIYVDDVGNNVGTINYGDNDEIILNIDAAFYREASGLEYILSSISIGKLNTYYLYNPITSGGSKLYKHVFYFTITDGTHGTTFNGTAVTKSSNQFTLSGAVLSTQKDVLSMTSLYNVSGGYAIHPNIDNFMGKVTFVYDVGGTLADATNGMGLSDTVTEL